LDGYYDTNFYKTIFNFKKGDMLNLAVTKKEGLDFADLVVGVVLVRYQEVMGDVVEESKTVVVQDLDFRLTVPPSH
jgi:hypothetical protein